MTAMDDVFALVSDGRNSLVAALRILDQRPDSRGDAEELRPLVGDLAKMLGGWDRERDRWR